MSKLQKIKSQNKRENKRAARNLRSKQKKIQKMRNWSMEGKRKLMELLEKSIHCFNITLLFIIVARQLVIL